MLDDWFGAFLTVIAVVITGLSVVALVVFTPKRRRRRRHSRRKRSHERQMIDLLPKGEPADVQE